MIRVSKLSSLHRPGHLWTPAGFRRACCILLCCWFLMPAQIRAQAPTTPAEPVKPETQAEPQKAEAQKAEAQNPESQKPEIVRTSVTVVEKISTETPANVTVR